MSLQSNVTPIVTDERKLRIARGEFVRSVIIEEQERSARFVAVRMGMAPSSMSERLNGRSPFLADELEGIARVLKIDPIEFYGRYISITTDDSNPRTLVPMVGGWGRAQQDHASVAQGIEHWFPVPGVARSNRVGGTTDGTVIPFARPDRPTIERDTLAPVTQIFAAGA